MKRIQCFLRLRYDMIYERQNTLKPKLMTNAFTY